MRSRVIALALLVIGIVVALLVGPWRMRTVRAAENDEVAVLDDCDPTDPRWAPTGGCALEEGAVNFSEFFALVPSPLSAATVGHPAWRNQPSYLKVEQNETVKVTNKGGRGHTFTEVKAYGGGVVPPLNIGLKQAEECKTATVLPPGTSTEVTGLSVGIHRFQCCIHPWMRALIKVKPKD